MPYMAAVLGAKADLRRLLVIGRTGAMNQVGLGSNSAVGTF